MFGKDNQRQIDNIDRKTSCVSLYWYFEVTATGIQRRLHY